MTRPAARRRPMAAASSGSPKTLAPSPYGPSLARVTASSTVSNTMKERTGAKDSSVQRKGFSSSLEVHGSRDRPLQLPPRELARLAPLADHQLLELGATLLELPRHAAPELGAFLEARPADGFPGLERIVDPGAQVPTGVLRHLADHLARVLVPDLNPSESQHPRRLALPRGWTGSWHPTWRRELSPAPAIRTLRCIGSGRRLENG